MTEFQKVYDLYFKDVYKYAQSRDPDVAEEEYPMATPEEEREHLYQHIFR